MQQLYHGMVRTRMQVVRGQQSGGCVESSVVSAVDHAERITRLQQHLHVAQRRLGPLEEVSEGASRVHYRATPSRFTAATNRRSAPLGRSYCSRDRTVVSRYTPKRSKAS